MALVNVPREDWCKCQCWRHGYYALLNHDKMRFCFSCGAELVKTREETADDERPHYIVPRSGYYYVGVLAKPERCTVFHVLKDGEREFLCGKVKPVGAQPPADVAEEKAKLVEEGKLGPKDVYPPSIRTVFVPDDGFVLVECDYVQAELFVTAGIPTIERCCRDCLSALQETAGQSSEEPSGGV